jgi:hypothetical protein
MDFGAEFQQYHHYFLDDGERKRARLIMLTEHKKLILIVHKATEKCFSIHKKKAKMKLIGYKSMHNNG